MVKPNFLYKKPNGFTYFNLCVDVFDESHKHKLFTCIVPWVVDSFYNPPDPDDACRERYPYLHEACEKHGINFYAVLESKRYKITNEDDAIDTQQWLLFGKGKSVE